jgi:hypothetical protein
LAFIPLATGAKTLAGYGLAKSESDILITKGIGKYFFNEDPTPSIKNQNVTLVLSLTAKAGNVYITGQVLDKDNGDAVIFEQTFVDTPAADVMSDGKDDPPAPFITTGNFVLYLYADGGTSPDGYRVVYDNAETFVTDTIVLDDFNAAQRSGWEDSNPINLPLPGGAQAGGQFTFTMSPLGQPYFVASTKKAKTYELAEGTRHELSVDLVEGLGADSFAVLGFIPLATGAKTLAGYGLAKSETDVLITKGIGKYFYNVNPTPPIKNQNVTLVLTLTVRKGNVIIRGRVLDKDDGNKVIFDKTFVDTPGADVFMDGKDDPPAPFITTGNVVLYLYADGGTSPDGYRVVYDNLVVSAPPAATNEPPVISEALPKSGANFLPATTTITFKVSDDKAIADSGVSVKLNGQVFTTANGLTLGGSGNTRTATLGGLAANTSYTAELKVVDSDGASATEIILFDTFLSSNRIIEIEDYNFESGQYFNNPGPYPEGIGQGPDTCADRVGVRGIDFNETRATPNNTDTKYRTQDPIRMQHSIDQRRPKFDPDQYIFDYDVGDIVAGEWMNYTREFEPGSYEVYLREAMVNFVLAESVLEQVTSDPTQPDQTVKSLGTFLGKMAGYTFRNVPLTDGTGQNKIVLRLSGKTTLRLRQVTSDTDSAVRYLNYLIFIPTTGPALQRATISSLLPANEVTVETVAPAIRVEIQNRYTSVKTNTIVLQLNGQAVIPKITSDANGAVVAYDIVPLPPSGATNLARIVFGDNEDVLQTNDWTFVIMYKALNPANRAPGPGMNPGFNVRVVQAPQGSVLANDLQRAEDQLALSASMPTPVLDTNVVELVINQAQDDRVSGYFPNETMVPGLEPDINGTDDFAVEIRAWLELAAGIHRFGVVTDDGYKISSGKSPADKEPILAYHNGGPANETFDFIVSEAGIYPFRMVWYERGGNAYAEWFSVNVATGERILIGDWSVPASIKAFTEIFITPQPVIKLESASAVTGPWVEEASAVVDTVAHTITIGRPAGAAKFYRLNSDALRKIMSINIVGQNIVLTYQRWAQ